MSEIQFDGASWPGILSFETATGTVSHGHEPDVITAVSGIPPAGIVANGDFTFTDGVRAVTFRDCKLASVQVRSGPGGFDYVYRILDRRWRWRYGEISGHYNARDRRDNLIPWQARTPKEIAELCLKAMGEARYRIDLPDGVSAAQLATFPVNPAPGEKTPASKTNPEVLWDATNPAVALDRFVQQFNRRLMLDPITDAVVIAKPGYGAGLPDNTSLDNVEEQLDAPATPLAVGVIGAPVRVQMILKLVAVGEEWDGRFLPIEDLSYKPTRKKQKGKWTITFTVTGAQLGQFSGVFAGHTLTADAALGAAGVASNVNAAAFADAGMDTIAKVSATSSGNTVTVTVEEVRDGQGLAFTPALTINGGAVAVAPVLVRRSNGSAWSGSDPTGFWDVVATDRLSYQAARQLALKTVYRYYRVSDDDASTPWDSTAAKGANKIKVPGYGEVARRQQLVLQPTMVEQVVPVARDPARVDTQNSQYLSEPPDYYDGYSRDRQPVVYGSIAVKCNGDWFRANQNENTPKGTRVAVAFSIDPANQLVVFGNPVYRTAGAGTLSARYPARLALETAVLVRDDTTFAPIRLRRWLPLDKPAAGAAAAKSDTPLAFNATDYELKTGNPKPILLKNVQDNRGPNRLKAGQDVPGCEWYRHDDVAYAIVGDYGFSDDKEVYFLHEALREPDDVSVPRADYYLGGHLLEHQVKGGQSAVYFGVHAIPLDGAIQQVTWEVGGGATTRASRNCEHSFFVPPLNARRRAENLRADETAATQNQAESARMDAYRGALNFIENVLPVARSNLGL